MKIELSVHIPTTGYGCGNWRRIEQGLTAALENAAERYLHDSLQAKHLAGVVVKVLPPKKRRKLAF